MLTHDLVQRVKRALRFSTLEGMAYGAVQGTGEYFTPAYAVALGASNSQLALLTSVPTFFGALAQTAAVRLVPLLGGRKRVVLLFAALSGSMWLPVMSVGYLFPGSAAAWLVAFLVLYTLFNAITIPAWGGIMAEVVPDQIRGRYFSTRSRWSTLTNMLTFLLAGGLLFLLRDRGVTGFALVFALALGFRGVSLALLTTLVELPHGANDDERVGLADFFRQLPRTNLGRAMLYLFCVYFVVNIGGPFFTPYMLRELKLDYLTFTVLGVASSLAALLVVTHWGTAADRAGNRRMLRWAGVLIGVVPLLWLFSRNVVFLGFVQVYTGVAWAGFNLVSTNFIYDATTAKNRTAYLAYFNAGVGIAGGLGALAGSLLVGQVPPLLGSALLTMFLLSGILRLLAALAFLPRLEEVRRVRQTSAAELFHIMVGGRPVHRAVGTARVQHHPHGHREAVNDKPPAHQ